MFEKDIRDCIENRTAGVDTADILEVKARTLETSSTVALTKRMKNLKSSTGKINWT